MSDSGFIYEILVAGCGNAIVSVRLTLWRGVV